MRQFVVFVALLKLLAFMVGCSDFEEARQSGEVLEKKEAAYANITPQEAKQRLDKDKSILLIDVRTVEEYEEKHIPGSILIPVDRIKEDAPSKLPDKDVTLFVYCRSGRRSVTASEALVNLGYTSVYNLGGILDWPYETEAGRN